MERSKPVLEEIISKTGNEKTTLMQLDISSFQSIRNFCHDFKSRFDRLDILIHNAAYFNHGEKYRLSLDHLELTFATNVFGPLLMTELLLPHLKKSEDPRILNASSNIIKHFFDPKRVIEMDNLKGENIKDKSFSVYKMYCSSKMALVMLTFTLAEEFQQHGIRVNGLQINGAKMSKNTLQKVTPGWRTIAFVQNLYFPPPEKIGNLYHELCTAEEFSDATGKLFNDKKEIMKPGIPDPGLSAQVRQLFSGAFYPLYADNRENREKLWKFSKEVIKNN
jgi:NAD(P)-dependent dehydrogenase (short-subunit alcohol dehydrogenase family)